MVDPSHRFHIADYAVFAVTVVVSIAIGIFYAFSGGRQRTTLEFLVGGRSMKYVPVAISLLATFESSIMILGFPAEIYVFGIQMWLGYVVYFIVNIFIVFTFVPLFHPLQLTSTFEYLDLRFNSKAVRMLGTGLGIWSYTWYMGIVLFGPAVALEAVTGFPQFGSIYVIAFVAVVYTSIGGLKAVIWTDVFQAAVMVAGMSAVLIKGTIDVGSASEVWHVARRDGRLDLFIMDTDPTVRHTFWNIVLGYLVRSTGIAFNQSTILRISSTKTVRDAKMVMLLVAPGFLITISMACYEGIVAYAYYETKGCDPFASKKISNPNQITPFIVMDIFHSLPGMPGLFLASLFSASLSTLSSSLSSLSALLWVDILKPRLKNISDLKATIIAKISVVVFGVLGCGVALLVSKIGGPLSQISGSLVSASDGPLIGIYLLGCFCPFANAKGVLIGGIVAICGSSWLALGQSFSKGLKPSPWLPPAKTDRCYVNDSVGMMMNTLFSNLTISATATLESNTESSLYPNTQMGIVDSSTASAQKLNYEPQGLDKFYSISYMWIPTIGAITTIVLGMIVSLLTGGNKPGEVHPRYLISFADYLLCYLPDCIRKHLRHDDFRSVDPKLDNYVPPRKGTIIDMEFTVLPDDKIANLEAAVTSKIDDENITDSNQINQIGEDDVTRNHITSMSTKIDTEAKDQENTKTNLLDKEEVNIAKESGVNDIHSAQNYQGKFSNEVTQHDIDGNGHIVNSDDVSHQDEQRQNIINDNFGKEVG